MKSIDIFKKNNTIIIHSNSKTVEGFWIAHEPFFFINIDEKFNETVLINAILNALDASKSNIKAPVDWSSSQSKFMESLGYKSYSKFVKGTILCNVSENNNQIKIVPTHNKGNKGFIHSKENFIINVNEVKEKLVKVLFEAFNKCE